MKLSSKELDILLNALELLERTEAKAADEARTAYEVEKHITAKEASDQLWFKLYEEQAKVREVEK